MYVVYYDLLLIVYSEFFTVVIDSHDRTGSTTGARCIVYCTQYVETPTPAFSACTRRHTTREAGMVSWNWAERRKALVLRATLPVYRTFSNLCGQPSPGLSHILPRIHL